MSQPEPTAKEKPKQEYWLSRAEVDLVVAQLQGDIPCIKSCRHHDMPLASVVTAILLQHER